MSQEFDEAEFWRTVEAIATEKPDEWANPKPKFDPKLHKDVRDEAVHGRKIEAFHQALQSLGMVCLQPQQLGYWNNGKPHTEPMWIHPIAELRISFTETDIITYFPGGPQEFFEWVTLQVRRLAAKRAGILLLDNQ